MSDDTTQLAIELQPKLPMSRALQLASAGVAVLTLFIAALSFILSFDALRALAIEIGMRPGRAWMAPVAIDVAQAAATAGYVIFRITDKGRYSLVYCAALAVVTVLLSVIGNAFHAWQTAERNIARVAAGEDLGFVPQSPWIAAVVAAIFPLLWLALFHLFVMMIQRNDAPAVARQRATTSPVGVPAGATPRPPVAPYSERPREVATTTQSTPMHLDNREDVFETERMKCEPVAATLPRTVTITNNSIAAPATGEVLQIEATRNGYPQTRDGLLRFLNDSDFHETVKIVASLMVQDPTLRQIDVADRLQIDKSTVSRRWRHFRQEAEAEGFSVPPLPVAETGDQVKETSQA
ncbi:DUF2637 domain-containing protein [Rhodococcus sp. p52]|uniref:DUF2637 domain-containing protein n=1 Tax=Rhodococcus sp. p52 TaxID=935199 RepID=UPI00068CB63F|nr:DUF2637 domain-containing protein [Rhodococcus sp. p52]